MSIRQTPEAATILNEIAKLYLNESYSDVSFVVDGERLPAHRNILGQRCPVFNAIFLKGEPVDELIKLKEAPVDALKMFLKFIYTGIVELDAVNVNIVFETVKLARVFEMTTLEEICVNHLKTICIMDNVTDLVNSTLERSCELTEFYLNYISEHYATFVKHETFKKVSATVLEWLFEDFILEASDKVIFNSFVAWMKANPSESAQFPKLLKHIKLNAIAVHDLVTAVRPLKLIDDKDLLDIVYEQAQAAIPKPIELPNCNVLSYQYGAKVLTGGRSTFFTMPDEEEDEVLQHHSSDNNENITVDLGYLFQLNHLVMELANGDWGYWIEVSEDNANWTRVVDYSKYVCRLVQYLYFEERPVRYIRIHGTNPADDMFEISGLEAYYTEDPLVVDRETGIAIPSENVALPEKDAIILQGNNYNARNGVIDSLKTEDIRTCNQMGRGSIILQLAQPYLLDNIGLSINVIGTSSYHVDVSTDKINWTRVFSKNNTSGWQLAKFEKQPVVFVKLTGTNNDNAHSFVCYRFECPAKPQI